jgi:hypothetical protein
MALKLDARHSREDNKARYQNRMDHMYVVRLVRMGVQIDITAIVPKHDTRNTWICIITGRHDWFYYTLSHVLCV